MDLLISLSEYIYMDSWHNFFKKQLIFSHQFICHKQMTYPK